jgi:dCTP deaminase
VSLLSDRDILRALDNRQISIEPRPDSIQPASVDLTLDREFLVWTGASYEDIDPRDPLTSQMAPRLIPAGSDEPFVLQPGEFALGATFERVSVDSILAARVEGKSSLGRLGLLVHATAGFIDPGFTGHITLELANVSGRPVRLYPGMKIAQLCFFDLTSRCLTPYGAGRNHYQGQRGPTASRAHLQFAGVG